jgi:hypothetical protein
MNSGNFGTYYSNGGAGGNGVVVIRIP